MDPTDGENISVFLNRINFTAMLTSKMFIIASFAIYGKIFPGDWRGCVNLISLKYESVPSWCASFVADCKVFRN